MHLTSAKIIKVDLPKPETSSFVALCRAKRADKISCITINKELSQPHCMANFLNKSQATNEMLIHHVDYCSSSVTIWIGYDFSAGKLCYTLRNCEALVVLFFYTKSRRKNQGYYQYHALSEEGTE